MVEPKDGLILLSERAALRPAGWVRLCCRLAGPIVRRWLKHREKRLERVLTELMQNVERCQTRGALEGVLGPPEYGMTGAGFSDGRGQPDLVESYARSGCRIELWFRGGRQCATTGFVDWTPWKIAERR
jgi:hypothetical protein